MCVCVCVIMLEFYSNITRSLLRLLSILQTDTEHLQTIIINGSTRDAVVNAIDCYIVFIEFTFESILLGCYELLIL